MCRGARFQLWRRGRDSNPRDPFGSTCSPSRRTRPLCDLSSRGRSIAQNRHCAPRGYFPLQTSQRFMIATMCFIHASSETVKARMASDPPVDPNCNAYRVGSTEAATMCVSKMPTNAAMVTTKRSSAASHFVVRHPMEQQGFLEERIPIEKKGGYEMEQSVAESPVRTACIIPLLIEWESSPRARNVL